MRTPFGIECHYFYSDYYRGRNIEECRLIGNKQPPHHWTRDLCENCPVPSILRANACSHMTLRGDVKRFFFGIKRKMVVTAYCDKSEAIVSEPAVGCGQCHPIPQIFFEK